MFTDRPETRTPFEQQAAYLAAILPIVVLSNTDPTGRGRGKGTARALPPAPVEIAPTSPAVEVCDLPVDPIARGRVITARLKAGEMTIPQALEAFSAAGPFQRRYVEITATEVQR